jgi:hypothetical protein
MKLSTTAQSDAELKKLRMSREQIQQCFAEGVRLMQEAKAKPGDLVRPCADEDLNGNWHVRLVRYSPISDPLMHTHLLERLEFARASESIPSKREEVRSGITQGVKTVFDLPIFRDDSKTLLSYAGGTPPNQRLGPPRYKRYQFDDGRHPPDTAGSYRGWALREDSQKRLMILAAFGDRDDGEQHRARLSRFNLAFRLNPH